jgi:hypothetical protein
MKSACFQQYNTMGENTITSDKKTFQVFTFKATLMH